MLLTVLESGSLRSGASAQGLGRTLFQVQTPSCVPTRQKETSLVLSLSPTTTNPIHEGSTLMTQLPPRGLFTITEEMRFQPMDWGMRKQCSLFTYILWGKHTSHSVDIVFVLAVALAMTHKQMRWTPYPSKTSKGPYTFLSALFLFSFCLKKGMAHISSLLSASWDIKTCGVGLETALTFIQRNRNRLLFL